MSFSQMFTSKISHYIIKVPCKTRHTAKTINIISTFVEATHYARSINSKQTKTIINYFSAEEG